MVKCFHLTASWMVFRGKKSTPSSGSTRPVRAVHPALPWRCCRLQTFTIFGLTPWCVVSLISCHVPTFHFLQKHNRMPMTTCTSTITTTAGRWAYSGRGWWHWASHTGHSFIWMLALHGRRRQACKIYPCGSGGTFSRLLPLVVGLCRTLAAGVPCHRACRR